MTRVAIIGGGIGGLTAAKPYARAGIETAVYEAAGKLGEIGRASCIPNAMKVLRAIGVEERRPRRGRAVAKWRVMAELEDRPGGSARAGQGAGGLLRHTGRDRAPGRTYWTCWPTRCGRPGDAGQTMPRRSGQGGAVAVARFADGSEIEADVIVGADGIHSPVRACLFGPDDPRFTGKICYRSIVQGRSSPRRPSFGADGVPVGSARTARSCCTRCGARN